METSAITHRYTLAHACDYDVQFRIELFIHTFEKTTDTDGHNNSLGTLNIYMAILIPFLYRGKYHTSASNETVKMCSQACCILHLSR